MHRHLRGFAILLLIFVLSLLGVTFFGLQLRRSQPPAPANFLSAQKGYGVSVDLTRYDDAALPDVLAQMQADGLTWLRQPVNWADIEPQPGRFNWAELDRVLAAVERANAAESTRPFKLIAVLQTSPGWARPAASTPTTPPAQLADFGNFARRVAARYGNRLDVYQIWHEPNLSANWGDTFVDAAAYANLLREAALNIRDADPTATILTAALAATTENGPLNLSDISYLDQLYQARAADWFDVLAVQPFGLWNKPLDPPAPNQANFRRVELLRQVMLNHGDAATPVWVTAFGWVALPANWSGRPSPWSHDLPSVQTNRTAQAIQYARANWPWLGPMLAVRWDAAGLPADDPARGFALTQTPPLLRVFRDAAAREKTTTPGRYPAGHTTGHTSPGWRFAAARADIPRAEPRRLTLFFEGTRLDLNIRRGVFRGYLWVTVDDAPANALPQDEQGRSYVVLYDPLAESAAVTLVRGLENGRHTAVIEADGGWEQWAIEGWEVAVEPDTSNLRVAIGLLGLLALFSGGGLAWQIARRPRELAAQVGGALFRLAAGWLWLVSVSARLATARLFWLVLPVAVALYFLPGWLVLPLFGLLALLIFLRPEVGLALVAFAAFFYQTPLQLPVGAFSPVELGLLLALGGAILRVASSWLARRAAAGRPAAVSAALLPRPVFFSFFLSPSSFDWAALALVGVALLSTLAAEHLTVALREFRTVIVESVLFYFLIRLLLSVQFAHLPMGFFANSKNGPNASSPTPYSLLPTSWFLIDAFVAGAVLQALLALGLYFFTDRSIDAEGVHRALGWGYGSPNNLALALGRAWPLLLAVAALPGSSLVRRGLYGAGLVATGAALYLTFSKGALLLGLPAGLLAMALFYLFRRGWPGGGRLLAAVGGVLALLAVALVPVSRTDRFRSTFDVAEGSTAFFRLKLWQSSLQMLRDFWPLGVGPDNFLYQYRTRYILPQAWQEPNLNHPHNIVLDFGVRLGVGGVAVLLWLQVAFWRSAWRLYRQSASPLLLGVMGSMAVTLAHGLVDNAYFLVDLALAFFLLVGLVAGLDSAARGPSDSGW